MHHIYNIYILAILMAGSLSLNAQNTYKSQSVLHSGSWHKISVEEEGIYKIDKALLEEAFGIQMGDFDPARLCIFGNRGGMLPERVDAGRTDDLEELPLYFSGDGDQQFENGEFFLFYAEGPEILQYDAGGDLYESPINIYEQKNYYFLGIRSENGKRISQLPSGTQPELMLDEYEDIQHYEMDAINLLSKDLSTIGSGKRWFGEIFSNQRSQDFTDRFDFNGIVPSSPIRFRGEFALRSNNSASARIRLNSYNEQKSVSGVNIINVLSRYARTARIEGQTAAPAIADPGQDDFELELSVNGGGSVFEAWLDYLQLRLIKKAVFSGDQLIFQHSAMMDQDQAGFEFDLQGKGGQTVVWDVSNPFETREIIPLNADQDLLEFSVEVDGFQRFALVHTTGILPAPALEGEVANQDLHAIHSTNMVLIYAAVFEEAALRLAEHRRQHSGIDLVAIPAEQVFNEFGGGSKDPTAIRDFAKMLYERSNDFKLLALFGDGSFDYRGLDENLPYSNFVPVYETDESLDPIESFPSDDYFALLSNGEGGDLVGALEIGVGRIPVMTPEEANVVVDKIIAYDSSYEAMGNWLQRIAFIADDEDHNQHLNQSIELANRVQSMHPELNQAKIFFDAYPQIATIGDERYPDAKEAINQNMFQGLLALNYFGHGGPKGWAQERVLELNDINGWSNYGRFPLFVTATCTFTGFDDPESRSGGELSLLNPNGGAIGLVTTVRAVYSNSNKVMTTALFDRLFDKDSTGAYPPLGLILRNSKNSNRQDTLRSNARKFTLIGDPSMSLALPEYGIVTTHINGREIATGGIDTVGALDKVTIRGYVAREDGTPASGFNGELIPTVFDKSKRLSTLGQDDKSFPKEFDVQNSILFKGKTNVTNGAFEFTFVVPKDIDYRYGLGRISYYARSEEKLDAAGYFEELVIGGTGSDVFVDDLGPEVLLYMNDEGFRDGGITGADPVLLVKLYDDNGINVSGNSIGHDLVGILDGDSQNSFIMNEYYEADNGDYRSGTVRFPLSGLSPGEHTIRVRAWDVANNMGEAEINFEVVSPENPLLINTIAYPNPFFERTNLRFEHNLAGKDLEVVLEIFDLQGKHVHTVKEYSRPAGNTYTISWDGTSFAGKAHPGNYLYRLKLRVEEAPGQFVESDETGGMITLSD